MEVTAATPQLMQSHGSENEHQSRHGKLNTTAHPNRIDHDDNMDVNNTTSKYQKVISRNSSEEPRLKRPPVGRHTSVLEDRDSSDGSRHADGDRSPRRKPSKSATFDRTAVFTEAEKKIIDAGKEVAMMKEKLLREQQQVADQQRSQAEVWVKMQARIEADEEVIANARADV